MKYWHQFLSVYFGFNKQQRNGLFVLMLLILALFIVRLSLVHFIKPEPMLIADFSHIKFSAPVKQSAANENTETALFVFDPNTVTKEQLVKLGFREKTANTFIKYREKGAKFRTKEDLKKVYGVSDQIYEKLEPFILIAAAKNKSAAIAETSTEPPKAAATPASKKIELNSADSVQLLGLKGIGPSFAKRILKYRSMLGGFVNIQQLKEVYGLDDELFNSVRGELTLNPALIKKIDINNPNFKELNGHPYISYEETKAIFNYRRSNGDIKTLGQLKEIITDESTIEKLQPYLEIP